MSTVDEKTETSFQLKADFFPITVVKLTTLDVRAIAHELENTIIKAPKYLINAPVILDIHTLQTDTLKKIDFKGIAKVFRERDIIPVGIRGLHERHKRAALDHGLAIMKPRPLNLADGNTPQAPAPAPKPTPVLNKVATKLITKPIRSGTQVYAKDADLVVLAAVNAGAECIADGNIHVYGPLRGRALAGANGNTQARIFCESLEAELLSIAGHYLVKDQIKLQITNKPLIQVFLENDKLQIQGI